MSTFKTQVSKRLAPGHDPDQPVASWIARVLGVPLLLAGLALLALFVWILYASPWQRGFSAEDWLIFVAILAVGLMLGASLGYTGAFLILKGELAPGVFGAFAALLAVLYVVTPNSSELDDE
jgi:hypothetical protein